ncbi:hypothetical protein LCGC14_2221710 [marine sediment metagenome]|uniref:Uncharacterized protein n=1 Tax=marine sediment metagenome TaxID=412755 RepID=A0A0F9DYD7_9ZZZZ
MVDNKDNGKNKGDSKMGLPAHDDWKFSGEEIAFEEQINKIMERTRITREEAIESLDRLENHPVVIDINRSLIEAIEEIKK